MYKQRRLALALGAFIVIVLSRAPFAPTALSFDSVNFAFSLQQFDPWMHQPQPPGYAFFVGEARLLNFLIRDPEKTFRWISIITTWLSVLAAFSLGRRMFGIGAAFIGAALLAFDPTIWYSGLDSPLRPHLTLFSLVIAALCWPMWNGEPRHRLLAAAALGIAGGFRPDLIVYLGPLWCVAMWRCRSPLGLWIRGSGIIFAFTAIWLGAAAWAVGGLDRYTLLMWVYGFSAMATGSVLLDASNWKWVVQVVRLIAWNGFGVLAWIWLLPFWFFLRSRDRRPNPAVSFVLCWIGPGIIAQGLLHVDAPGHALFSIAALCLVGGRVIAATCEAAAPRYAVPAQAGAATLAVVLNSMFFLNVIPVRFSPPSFTGEPGKVVTTAFVDAVNQATLKDLRSNNQLAEASVRELKRLMQGDRPVVVISTEGSSRHFRFLSARVASYYVADYDFWVVTDEASPPRASRIRGKDLLEIRYGAPVKIEVPRGSRIIWLMDPASPFREAVSEAVSLSVDGSVFHTDLGEDQLEFRVDKFEFQVAAELNREP